VRLELKRHRIAEKITWDKHVVAAGWLTWDAGSIPAASTILNFFCVSTVIMSGSRKQAERAGKRRKINDLRRFYPEAHVRIDCAKKKPQKAQ